MKKMLLVIGVAATGTVWGCVLIGVTFIWANEMLQVTRGDAGAAMGEYLRLMFAGLCCGAPLGLFTGIPLGLKIANESDGNWSPLVWVGVVLGAIAGLAFSADCGLGQVIRWSEVLAAALIALMSATVGGLTAKVGEGLWKHARKWVVRRIEKRRRDFALTILMIGFVIVPLFAGITLLTLFYRKTLSILFIAHAVAIGIPLIFGLLFWQSNDPRIRR